MLDSGVAGPVNVISWFDEPEDTYLHKYREFVTLMVNLTAGEASGELCAAIEKGTVNWNAVAYLLPGFLTHTQKNPPNARHLIELGVML
jgi:hypothetical protein